MDIELKALGFSANTSRIYLSLVRKPGSAKAGELIKQTELPRSVVYGCLKELAGRGLITEKQVRGVLTYSANDPEALIRENKSRLERAHRIAVRLKQEEAIKERQLVVFEGDDVIKTIAEKSLEVQSNETIYFLGSSKFGSQGHLESYWRSYHKKRIAAGISCKILYDNDTDRSTIVSRNILEKCEAKFMPFGTDMPMWYCIFGDFVATILPSEEPPFAFLVRSKKASAALKEYFGYLWERGSDKR